MTPEPLVRPARPADLAAVAAIYAPYVTDTVVTFELDPPTVAAWQERYDAVAAAGLPFLVAVVDGVVVGYAYASPWKPRPAYRHTAEVSIYLAAAAQGRGTGGVLLDRLVEECRRSGRRELIAVIADAGLPASVALHRSRGFVDAGRLRAVGHKLDRWIDTVLLQLRLGPGAEVAE